jgi:hypothetical protein
MDAFDLDVVFPLAALDEELDLLTCFPLGPNGSNVNATGIVVEEGEEEGSSAERSSTKQTTKISEDQLPRRGCLGRGLSCRQPGRLSHDAARAVEVIYLSPREHDPFSQTPFPSQLRDLLDRDVS